ncbi:MAG: tryptophan-rich sensory protein [Betaproteobacteria bacterium]|nr:tryptophan-rich sensory protein [Betaproteobacteria bacterium]
MSNMQVKSPLYKPLLLSIVLVLCTAATGMIFLPGAWYEALHKPSWTPANWVFPVVWSVMYLIGIAVGTWVLRKGSRVLTILWLIQLLFNGCWSYFVFGRHQLFLGFIDIICLWLTILLFLIKVFDRKRWVFFLFSTYLGWVSIALLLNMNLWLLNK